MRATFQILAIPYRLKPNLQYCVLHRSDIDQYQFVAGGGEDDEQPIEAAAREIYEETSVKARHIVPLTSMAYIPANVISKKHRDLWSHDTIAIPEYTFGFECGSKIVLSSEHNGFEWLTYDEAITRLTWDSNKTALYELNCRLLEACQIGGLEGKNMLEILKARFQDNKNLHMELSWLDVEKRLLEHPGSMDVLRRMEESGGEPDTIGYDEKTGKLIFCDCAKESPSGRRSLCYDERALQGRAKNPPLGSAELKAKEIGVLIMTEELYRRLQSLGEFDLKTSSWIATPDDIRDKGGALFCERRYGTVFTFHNGADSYYSVRGFRGYTLI